MRNFGRTLLKSEGVAGHILNGGATCAGETGNSLLLYPGPHNPVETNEEWQYNPTTGVISTQEGNLIGLSAGSTSAKMRFFLSVMTGYFII